MNSMHAFCEPTLSLSLLIPDNASKSDFDTLGYEWVNCRPDIQTGESLPSWRKEVRGALSRACLCLSVCLHVSVCLPDWESAQWYACVGMPFCVSDLLSICPRTRLDWCVCTQECIWLINTMGRHICRITNLMLAATSNWGARPAMMKCVQRKMGECVSG